MISFRRPACATTGRDELSFIAMRMDSGLPSRHQDSLAVVAMYNEHVHL